MGVTAFAETPVKVVHAVKLLYLIVGLGIVRTAMTVIRHADVRDPYFLIATKFSVYVASLFLIYQLARGKNWARWALVITFALGVPLSILPTLQSVAHNPVHALLGLLQLALYIVVLFFLFDANSARWYRSGKSHRDG